MCKLDYIQQVKTANNALNFLPRCRKGGSDYPYPSHNYPPLNLPLETSNPYPYPLLPRCLRTSS